MGGNNPDSNSASAERLLEATSRLAQRHILLPNYWLEIDAVSIANIILY